MDDRKERIGEHAAEHARLGYHRPRTRPRRPARPARLAAARQLDRRLPRAVRLRPPGRPDRTRTHRGRPDKRAAWYEAFAALGPSTARRPRHARRQLLHLRDTYPVDTAWAPPWIGDELRQVRLAAATPPGRCRADAEAAAAQRAGQRPGSDTAPRARCQLPGHGQGLRGPRARVRRRHGRSDRLGSRHPRPPPPGRRRRRRTASPASRSSASPRSARPNHRPPPTPSAPSSPWPRGRTSPRRTSGSRTWPPDAGHSPTGSPTGRARPSRPKTPNTATSARRSRPGPAPRPVRSCSLPSRRSVPRPGSWSASWTATPTSKRGIEAADCIPTAKGWPRCQQVLTR